MRKKNEDLPIGSLPLPSPPQAHRPLNWHQGPPGDIWKRLDAHAEWGWSFSPVNTRLSTSEMHSNLFFQGKEKERRKVKVFPRLPPWNIQATVLWKFNHCLFLVDYQISAGHCRKRSPPSSWHSSVDPVSCLYSVSEHSDRNIRPHRSLYVSLWLCVWNQLTWAAAVAFPWQGCLLTSRGHVLWLDPSEGPW